MLQTNSFSDKSSPTYRKHNQPSSDEIKPKVYDQDKSNGNKKKKDFNTGKDKHSAQDKVKQSTRDGQSASSEARPQKKSDGKNVQPTKEAKLAQHGNDFKLISIDAGGRFVTIQNVQHKVNAHCNTKSNCIMLMLIKYITALL